MTKVVRDFEYFMLDGRSQPTLDVAEPRTSCGHCFDKVPDAANGMTLYELASFFVVLACTII